MSILPFAWAPFLLFSNFYLQLEQNTLRFTFKWGGGGGGVHVYS